MYLGRRRRINGSSFEVIFWPCVETTHVEDLADYPDDVCLYYDALPGNQSRAYMTDTYSTAFADDADSRTSQADNPSWAGEDVIVQDPQVPDY
ncbi:MAG TPA: hypothetical protein VFY89_09750 [Ktedonobacterales bacterium]